MLRLDLIRELQAFGVFGADSTTLSCLPRGTWAQNRLAPSKPFALTRRYLRSNSKTRGDLPLEGGLSPNFLRARSFPSFFSRELWASDLSHYLALLHITSRTFQGPPKLSSPLHLPSFSHFILFLLFFCSSSFSKWMVKFRRFVRVKSLEDGKPFARLCTFHFTVFPLLRKSHSHCSASASYSRDTIVSQVTCT